MKNKPINIAVVGCGYWGPNLIRNFRVTPGAKVKTICDMNTDRLAQLGSLYPEVQTETRFENVLDDKSIDAIVVATPVRFHHKMAKAALEAGKHTFIEKPMASSSAECEELNDIARKNHLTLMIGHTFLYSSPVRKIKEIVQSGDIGQIQLATVESGSLPEGYQCRVGSGAARYFDHSLYHGANAIERELPRQLPCDPWNRRRDQHGADIQAQSTGHDPK